MRTPRKVLFCIDAMARGGTELQLSGLIDRLDRERIAPALLTLRESPADLNPDDCEVLAWNVPRLFSPHGLQSGWRLSRWLRRNSVQAVHTFFQDSTIFCGPAARLAGVPVRLAGFRDLGFWRRRDQEILMRLAYPNFTGYVANSEMVKRHFCDRDQLAPERVRVIPNGIDIQGLPWVDHVGSTRAVAIVGNLNRQVKRVDLFIRAAGILKPSFPEVVWHIFGDGGLRPELEHLAGEVGVGKQVRFHGRVDGIGDELAGVQLGVNCSDSEGFSNAVLEYMLRGCAVVATDVGGNTEALKDGRTGILVPAGDAVGLAEGLRIVLNDDNLRRKLALAARADAAETYGWERCVDAHEKIYLGLD